MIDKEKELHLLLDFSNIVHENQSWYRARFQNYEIIRSRLEELLPFSKIIPISDAKTRYKIDNRYKYNKLCEQGILIQAPVGEKSDYYFIKFANNNANSLIISNDKFKQYKLKNGLSKRVIRFKIIADQAYFSEKLDNFL